jgi:hypothetical protein
MDFAVTRNNKAVLIADFFCQKMTSIDTGTPLIRFNQSTLEFLVLFIFKAEILSKEKQFFHSSYSEGNQKGTF